MIVQIRWKYPIPDYFSRFSELDLFVGEIEHYVEIKHVERVQRIFLFVVVVEIYYGFSLAISYFYPCGIFYRRILAAK